MRVSFTLSIEEADLLAVLASTSAVDCDDESKVDRVGAVIQHLIDSAADGVRRPGSWERGWVEQAFGSVDEGALEVDEDAPWRRRPR